MLDHFGFCVQKFEESVVFYENCLRPLGLQIIERHDYGAVIFAKSLEEEFPFIWIGKGPCKTNLTNDPHASPVHFAFRATSKEAVDEFYKLGLEFGGVDNGKPGDRDPGYYAAYVFDPNGFNIEAGFRK